MTDEARFLAKIRAIQPPPVTRDPASVSRTFAVSDLDVSAEPASERFARALALMGGDCVTLPASMPSAPSAPSAALAAWLLERFGAEAVVCSAVPEIRGTRVLNGETPPASLEDVDVGVVRARFGVAETGSVFLSDAEYIVNALGYLVQHLVVLLDPDAIEENIATAYQRPDFAQARYAALVTGPSATADIEGVLIRGAQGVRSLTVLWHKAGTTADLTTSPAVPS